MSAPPFVHFNIDIYNPINQTTKNQEFGLLVVWLFTVRKNDTGPCFFCAFMGENWMTEMPENWEITDNLDYSVYINSSKIHFFIRANYIKFKYFL